MRCRSSTNSCTASWSNNSSARELTPKTSARSSSNANRKARAPSAPARPNSTNKKPAINSDPRFNMILLFPNADTLKLALASSIVGHEVTLAPATLSTDAHGRFYVEPSIDLSRTTAKNLDRIGVKGSKRHGSTSPEPVANWLQIVPLQKVSG